MNPGFTGSAGRVLTVNFRTKGGGSAPVTFSTGSILANDGLGTNVLSGLGSANFIIEIESSSPASESDTPSPITGTPAAPQITSVTHPDPDGWYSNIDAEFSWTIPAGVTSARLLVGHKPQATPAVTYTPAIGYKKITDLEDGTWYFHVRLGSAAGWGGISHFRFQIDTQDPEYFNITAMERTDLTEPTASFIFEAEDVISGIAHYEIQIDDSESQIWQDDGEHVYQTPILSPGRHTLIAKAVDRAGNSLANFTEFIVSALDAPIITDYPKVVDSWESFVVNGTTYPNAQVVIWMQARDSNPISHIIQSGGDGKFSFSLAEKIAEGKYKLWAEVIDERGARSNPTDKLSTEIQKPAFWRMGLMAINVLSIIIPLIALVFLLAFGLWFSWHKFMQMRKRVRKEVGEAEEVLSKSFDALRKSVASRLNTLEKTGKKRKLTAAEARLVRQLKKDLNAAEKSVRKEIKDIAKQVK